MYIASLLFDDDFMARLGARLAALPALRTIATLRQFPEGSLPGFVEADRNLASFEETLRERLDVTWGAARVFVYRRSDIRHEGL